jgi:hypothetical protein
VAQSILDDLIRQQRRLRSQRADKRLLDANKLGIIYWREQLDRTSSPPNPHLPQALDTAS